MSNLPNPLFVVLTRENKDDPWYPFAVHEDRDDARRTMSAVREDSRIQAKIKAYHRPEPEPEHPTRAIGCIYQIHRPEWLGFRRIVVTKQTKKRIYFNMLLGIASEIFHLSHTEFSQAIEAARSVPFDRKHARNPKSDWLSSP